MTKESGDPAGKVEYYNSRFSDAGKDAQGTSTPRSLCRRMPAHGLYFFAASVIHMCVSSAHLFMTLEASLRAILPIVASRIIYHCTATRRMALAPALPKPNSSTQDVPSCFVVMPPTGSASLLLHNLPPSNYSLCSALYV